MSQVNKISKELKRISYKAGDFVFFEGDLDSDFYIVEKGQVQIFTKNNQGKRLNLQMIEQGESFGEFALLDHQPRSASAQAMVESIVIRVAHDGYKQLLDELPLWASSMLKSFSQRLRNMNSRFKDVPQFVSYKDSKES